MSFASRQSALQVEASHAMLSTQQTVHAGDRPTRSFMHASPAWYLLPNITTVELLKNARAELPMKQQLKRACCGGGCQVVAGCVVYVDVVACAASPAESSM